MQRNRLREPVSLLNRSILKLHLASGKINGGQMCRYGECPADGIREEQIIQRGTQRENRIDPDDSKDTGTQGRNDQRRPGLSKSAQNARCHIHHSADEIGQTDIAQTCDARGQNSFQIGIVAGNIEGEKRSSEGKGQSR